MDGDYGTKRYINHFKEHWEQFLLPHKEQWNKKYPNVKLKYFISEVTNECSVFGTKINHFGLFKQHGFDYYQKIVKNTEDNIELNYHLQKNFTVQIKNANKNKNLYLNEDVNVLKDLLLKNEVNINLTNDDYRILLDLLSIDKILIPELSYSSNDYLKTTNQHKEGYIERKTKENPEVPIELYSILSSRDVSNNAKFLEKRPFIKLSNGRYLIDSLLTINYLDRIVSNIIYNGDIQSFNDVHAPNFERYILNFVKKIFPTAKFYHSYKYNKEAKVNPEIDLLVNIDNHTLLVCEMKSGKIVFNSPSVDENYIKPQKEQLTNFITLLNNSEKLIIKKTKNTTTDSEEELELNKNNFQKVIPILITQDSLGMMPLKNKYDCLAYSIDDLIIFRDILQTSIQWVDFFSEHLSFNECYKNTTFIGDVIDILEYYLLNQLHSDDYKEGTICVLMTNNNEKITEYMFSLLCNKPISPPKMDLQKNINFLLEALDKFKPNKYLQLGYDLIMSTLELKKYNNIFEKSFIELYQKQICFSGFIFHTNNKKFRIYRFYLFNSSLKKHHNSINYKFQKTLQEENIKYLNEKKQQILTENNITIDTNNTSFYETIIYIDNKKNVKHISINEIDIIKLIN